MTHSISIGTRVKCIYLGKYGEVVEHTITIDIPTYSVLLDGEDEPEMGLEEQSLEVA